MNTAAVKYRKGGRKSHCHYCGIALVYVSVKQGNSAPLDRATIDHRVPVCRGGADSIENFVFCCRKCNEEKGQLTDKEYLVVLRYRKIQSGKRALLAVLFVSLVKIMVLVRKFS